MKTRQFFLIVLLGFIAISCNTNQAENNPAQENLTTQKEKVRVVNLVVQEVSREIENSASLQAWEELHYSPASPGRIENILVDVGSKVKKGDVLVQMDRTQLKQAEIQLNTLEADYHRLDTLRKMGSIAQQQFDQMKAQYDVAKSNIDFLRQNTRLVAPFSGIISGRYFEPGEMYTGSPVMAIGKPAVISMIQVDQLKMLVSVSERYFPVLTQNSKVTVTTDVYSQQVFEGKINRIYPTIDPMSRTFKVEIQVKNPEGVLAPGMFARVSIEFEKVSANLLPAIAVLKMQGSKQRYVYVNRDGIARRIFVQTGKRIDDQLEVISDELKIGDEIVFTGQARLVDGTPIEVVQ
jgi:membrane fusion protein, multidrug efflux system